MDVGGDIAGTIPSLGALFFAVLEVVGRQLKFECALGRLPFSILGSGLDDARDVQAELVNTGIALLAMERDDQSADHVERIVTDQGFAPPCPLVA